MSESHRDVAIREASSARDLGESLYAVVHALLAVEDRLDAIASVLAQGGDVRRFPADAKLPVAGVGGNAQ